MLPSWTHLICGLRPLGPACSRTQEGETRKCARLLPSPSEGFPIPGSRPTPRVSFPASAGRHRLLYAELDSFPLFFGEADFEPQGSLANAFLCQTPVSAFRWKIMCGTTHLRPFPVTVQDRLFARAHSNDNCSGSPGLIPMPGILVPLPPSARLEPLPATADAQPHGSRQAACSGGRLSLDPARQSRNLVPPRDVLLAQWRWHPFASCPVYFPASASERRLSCSFRLRAECGRLRIILAHTPALWTAGTGTPSFLAISMGDTPASRSFTARSRGSRDKPRFRRLRYWMIFAF